MVFELAGEVPVVSYYADFEVVLKRPGGQVGRADEGASTVDHEQLGVEQRRPRRVALKASASD